MNPTSEESVNPGWSQRVGAYFDSMDQINGVVDSENFGIKISCSIKN